MTHNELIIAEYKARNAGNLKLAEQLKAKRWELAFNYRNRELYDEYNRDLALRIRDKQVGS